LRKALSRSVVITMVMRYGDNELYQIIITPGIDNERPMTRDYLYAEESNTKGFNDHMMQFDENIKSTI